MVGFSVSNYKEIPVEIDKFIVCGEDVVVPLQRYRPESCSSCKFIDRRTLTVAFCSKTKIPIIGLEVRYDCPLPEKEEMNSEW